LQSKILKNFYGALKDLLKTLSSFKRKLVQFSFKLWFFKKKYTEILKNELIIY